MKIISIIYQHRRDFTADIICEGCGNRELLTTGYDDRNYHDNVMPNMKCSACGESQNSLGIVAEKIPTKYADHETV